MKPLTNSERLRRKLALALPQLVESFRAIREHPQIAELYPDYLFTIHCIIRASVPLMEAALTTASRMAGRDPVAERMVPYLTSHITEELHHDEWLLEDLGVLGSNREELLERLPSATVAAMAGAQYYWIFHYHPVALLGYIAVMEGYPPSPRSIEELVARTGGPPAAFRTLLKHAALDPHHCSDLDEMLDSLPLTPALSAILGVSALHTMGLSSLAFVETARAYAAAGEPATVG